jgi:penicillin-binding protein 1C
MLDDGKILQHSLLSDVPLIINGFAPQNFSKQYDGAVPADQALIRSLNVPAVQMLQSYRYERFYELLKNMGMSTLSQPADHYGLALILGGAEGSLWDITGMYASMARTLNHYFDYAGSLRYNQKDFHSLRYIDSSQQESKELSEVSWVSAQAIYQTFDALKEMYRPGEESGWRNFSSSQKIAWKTGTSYGFRDAWAVGVTGKLAVGVWVGNADGEGRPGLTGAETAAPIMFDLFDMLEHGSWFKQPKQAMTKIEVCARSGYRAGDFCDQQEEEWVQSSGLQMPICPYHTIVHLTTDKKYRVNSECEKVSNMVNANWFVLPPVQEYYYKSKNLSYKALPAIHPNCRTTFDVPTMELVYPRAIARLYIPKELDGTSGVSVFELAHRFPLRTVYWHLDGEYLGSTSRVHQMAVNANAGHHRITIVDDSGEVLEKDFEVLSTL